MQLFSEEWEPTCNLRYVMYKDSKKFYLQQEWQRIVYVRDATGEYVSDGADGALYKQVKEWRGINMTLLDQLAPGT